jgi:hypothetical protein
LAWVDLGNTPDSPESICDLDATKKLLVDSVQLHLDRVAQLRGYDNILSLCSYDSSTNAQFLSEASVGIAWRNACWLYCYFNYV